MPQSSVVITGIGVLSPIGIGCEAFFRALLEQQSGIRSLAERTDDGARPAADSEPAGLWIGAPILDFDPKQYVRPRKALKVMCREIQLAFAAAQLALDDAGLQEVFPADAEGKIQPRDVGAVFGSEMFYGPPTEMEEVIKHCRRPDGSIDGSQFGGYAMRDIMPLWMLKYLPNMPACHVGIALGAHGPNNTLVLSDISGPAALIEGVGYLQRGIAKTMVIGAIGTRINTTRLNYRGDVPIPEVADPVSHSSLPHNPASRGVVGGEAAVSLILESEDDATQRNGRPLARVRSWSNRFYPSDGMKLAKRTPSLDAAGARGSARSIRMAVESALSEGDLSPEQIGLVVSHASGDPVVDAAEREAIGDLFTTTPMVAPMASIGHTGAASGQMGIAVGCLALSQKTIPPTLGAAATGVPLRSQAEPLQSEYVLCLAHNNEGNATAIVLQGV